MSRISIDVTEREHKRLKAMAALQGQSIKDYVLDRTLGAVNDEEKALEELERILDDRIRQARKGGVSRKSATQIFEEVIHAQGK